MTLLYDPPAVTATAPCDVPFAGLVGTRFRTVTVHRAGVQPTADDSGGTPAGFPDLPGFSCPVAVLFRWFFR